jgi:hypothetical protein
MVKKIEPLSNWIPCHQAAPLLIEKNGLPCRFMIYPISLKTKETANTNAISCLSSAL